MDGSATIAIAPELQPGRTRNPHLAASAGAEVAGETSGAEPESRAASEALVSPRGSFRARLNYDRERAEVYIEILDPRTGDVIQRLPPDQAAEEYAPLRHGGSFVDDLA